MAAVTSHENQEYGLIACFRRANENAGILISVVQFLTNKSYTNQHYSPTFTMCASDVNGNVHLKNATNDDEAAKLGKIRVLRTRADTLSVPLPAQILYH